MAGPEDVRTIALSLEGTREAPHFDRTAYKVARIYATMDAAGVGLNLKLTPDEQAMKAEMAPEVFSAVPNAWGAQGWTQARLAEIGIEELEQVLRMAWAHALKRR